MREHIQLAERIVASATAVGITATMSRVGESNIVVLCHAAGGRPVAVRISDFPARLLRGQLYDDLARAGWSGDAHIVDISLTPREDVTHHSAAAAAISVLTHFGIDPEIRDQIASRTAAEARRHRGAQTRTARHEVIEQAFSEQAAAAALSTDSGPLGDRVRDVIAGAGLPDAAQRRITVRTLELLAPRIPALGLAAFPAPWHDLLRIQVRHLVHARLSALTLEHAPLIEADALRICAWDTLRDMPIEWRLQQHEWLSEWSQVAPESDLVSDAEHGRLFFHAYPDDDSFSPRLLAHATARSRSPHRRQPRRHRYCAHAVSQQRGRGCRPAVRRNGRRQTRRRTRRCFGLACGSRSARRRLTRVPCARDTSFAPRG